MENYITSLKKKGLIVYTTLALQKANQYSVEVLKSNPKEAFLCFSKIVSVSTKEMPNNWIAVKIINDDRIFYEDRSICNFIQIAKINNVVFQKISSQVAINISMVKFKSNLTVVELINGDIYKITKHFKREFKNALLTLWEE